MFYFRLTVDLPMPTLYWVMSMCLLKNWIRPCPALGMLFELTQGIIMHGNYKLILVLVKLQYFLDKLTIGSMTTSQTIFKQLHVIMILNNHFRYGVGMIYQKQEKFSLAEVHFRKALSINPKSPALLCHIGVVSSFAKLAQNH